MKEVIFNYNDYKSKNETYKDFYRDLFIKLDGKGIIDFADCEDLHYHADMLNEFMWYVNDEDLKIIFLNLDTVKIAKQKTGDDYHWGLILEVLQEFVTEFPNNSLEFRNE